MDYDNNAPMTPEEVRRLERMVQAIVLVHNPLDEPFDFEYDGYDYHFEAGQDKPLPFYIGEIFLDKLTKYLMVNEAAKAIEDLDKTRKRKGVEPLDPQKKVYIELKHLNQQQYIDQYAPQVIVKVVSTLGEEKPPLDKEKKQSDLPMAREAMFKILKGDQVIAGQRLEVDESDLLDKAIEDVADKTENIEE